MSFHQNTDVNVKFRYCLNIIDLRIDVKQLNSCIIHQNTPEFSESIYKNMDKSFFYILLEWINLWWIMMFFINLKVIYDQTVPKLHVDPPSHWIWIQRGLLLQIQYLRLRYAGQARTFLNKLAPFWYSFVIQALLVFEARFEPSIAIFELRCLNDYATSTGQV